MASDAEDIQNYTYMCTFFWDRVSCSTSWPPIDDVPEKYLEILIILPFLLSVGTIGIWYHAYLVYLILGLRIQGLMHSRKALYQLSYIPSPVYVLVYTNSVARQSISVCVCVCVYPCYLQRPGCLSSYTVITESAFFWGPSQKLVLLTATRKHLWALEPYCLPQPGTYEQKNLDGS